MKTSININASPVSALPKRGPERLQGNQVFYWILFSLLVAITGLLAILMVIGGSYRIKAWFAIRNLIPLAGFSLSIIQAIILLIKRRTGSAARWSLLASCLWMTPAILWFVRIPYPASLVSTTPAVSVRLPADGPLKVWWGGDSVAANYYHAITPEERWAYDLAVVPFFSQSANLADYGCYGIPVVAPAAGVVVEIHDGEPDQTPGVLVKNPVNPGGNWIAIQLDETGTFLILAHLKPDRMMVSVGDHVSEGQELGRCGNSGNSSEPHIHIHHQREDPRITARGWAEGLPLYFRDLDGDAMPQGGLDGGIVQHIGANE